MSTTTETQVRSISSIAYDIAREWSKSPKGINFAAKPYLIAMKQLNTVTDNYGLDSGRSILIYFLSNAGSFRGEKAKALKAELKEMLK